MGMDDERKRCIARVLRSQRCLYTVLELDESCTDEDVLRQYKQMAKLLHPDRNSFPGAEEAFKLVGLAKEQLGTARGREKYNFQKQLRPSSGSAFSDAAAGARGDPFSSFGRRRRQQAYEGHGMGESDLEELLRRMFMQQMHSHRAADGRTRRPGMRGGVPPGVRVHFDVPREESMPYLSKCFMLVLVIFLYFFFSLASVSHGRYGTPTTNFSLRHTYEFKYEYTTQSGVRFFMAAPISVISEGLAVSVENAYVRQLVQECQEEERENARARRYQRYIDPKAEVEESTEVCEHLRLFRAFLRDRGLPGDFEL